MVTALALNCTLKPSPANSSTEPLLAQCIEALRSERGRGDEPSGRRLPGAPRDGDEWPQLRQEVLDADILLMGTPTWLGQMSSVAQRVLARLDAELSEVDNKGRPALAGNVAAVCVVGNEYGSRSTPLPSPDQR